MNPVLLPALLLLRFKFINKMLSLLLHDSFYFALQVRLVNKIEYYLDGARHFPVRILEYCSLRGGTCGTCGTCISESIPVVFNEKTTGTSFDRSRAVRQLTERDC
jgi:hypothetical protein